MKDTIIIPAALITIALTFFTIIWAMAMYDKKHVAERNYKMKQIELQILQYKSGM